jgi:hypothetical protein
VRGINIKKSLKQMNADIDRSVSEFFERCKEDLKKKSRMSHTEDSLKTTDSIETDYRSRVKARWEKMTTPSLIETNHKEGLAKVRARWKKMIEKLRTYSN